MRVKEIMQNVIRISSGSSICQVAITMDKNGDGSLLVEEDDNVIGLITEKSIFRKIIIEGKNLDDLGIKDVMNASIITIDADEDILEANKLIDRHRVDRLMVTEKGEIIGKVTADSINRNLKFDLVKGYSIYSRKDY